MADLTKYSKGKRMVFEQDIKQIAENTKEIVDLKEDLQGKVNSYVVTDIKALTSDFINKLKSGDVVVKQTGSGQHPQYHSYRVSFMKDNEGMCLTYVDASCSETVSYDNVEGTWSYNSTDITRFDDLAKKTDLPEVITPVGTEPTAQGLKINGVDYKVGGQEVHLYQHRIHLETNIGSDNNFFIQDLVIYTTINEAFTKASLIDYWSNYVGSTEFPIVGGQIYSAKLASSHQYNVGYRYVINNNNIQAMYYNSTGYTYYLNVGTFNDRVTQIF